MVKSFRLRRKSVINDSYTIIDRLGRGWEGEVYRVSEIYSGGSRVLKLFDPKNYRSKAMSAYCAKMERLSSVRGIVRFYHGGWWEKKDAYYVVAEYCAGNPLDRVAHGKVPIFRALRIVRAMLHTVDACHARKECLGDLHLGNVIGLTDDSPVIIDYDSSVKYSRMAVREDVVALCKMFFEMTKLVMAEAPPELVKVLPKYEDAIQRRYGKASELLDALDGLMGRETRA